MTVISFLFLAQATINTIGSSAYRDAGSATVITGSELSIINKAATRAGLTSSQLNCYDISIIRQGSIITIGFVPRLNIRAAGGKLQKKISTSCKSYSFLYTDDGTFIKSISVRDHGVVR